MHEKCVQCKHIKYYSQDRGHWSGRNNATDTRRREKGETMEIKHIEYLTVEQVICKIPFADEFILQYKLN